MQRVVGALCGLALLVAGGCATAGGVEVAGRASQVSPPPSPPTLPSGTPGSADAIAILRADPQVSAKIKAGLVPCEGGYYPTDDRYVDLTGDGAAELVVTLLSCPASPRAKEKALPYDAGSGYAAYVYDLETKPPTRLLAFEDGNVELVPYTGKGDDLALIRTSWGPRDDPCCPSQTFALYRWDGTKLVEVPR